MISKITTFVLLLLPFVANAQIIHSVEFISSASAGELESQLNIEAINGVDFYRVLYYTNGTDGMPDTASGLFAIPDSDGSLPLVIYHHGTSSARNLVPSSLNLDYSAYTGIAASGFITLAPDFLGMGNSRGFHPYVHRETQASASIDLLKAFQEWYENEDVPWNGQLFLTGYSQGGHASMATHLELETKPDHGFEVTAAAHLSGPYSISTVMRDLMFSERDYLTVGFIPFVILGYQEAYGDFYDDLEDILRPGFIGAAMNFYNGTIDLNQLTLNMIIRMGIQYGNIHPVNVFNPQFVSEMGNNPELHANLILRENDTYDWSPQVPTRLYFCSGDEVVPPQNSLLADSVMNANMARDVRSVDLGGALGHSACARPALLAAIDFFNSFLVSGSDDIAIQTANITVYPNPASDVVHLRSAESDQLLEVEIYDIAGQLMLRTEKTSTINIQKLHQGNYVLKITTLDGIFAERLSVSR